MQLKVFRDKEWLYQKYVVERKSIPQVAREAGCNGATLRYWLIKHSIPRRTLSESQKGIVKTVKNKLGKLDVACKVCGKPLKRWPFETEKTSIFFCSKECRSNYMSEFQSGENGPNWKGGKWNNRVQVLAHTSYRTLRKKIIKRDKHCRLCGSTNNLVVHHIKQRKDHPEQTWDPDNLTTLCKKCHSEIHRKKLGQSSLLPTFLQA